MNLLKGSDRLKTDLTRDVLLQWTAHSRVTSSHALNINAPQPTQQHHIKASTEHSRITSKRKPNTAASEVHGHSSDAQHSHITRLESADCLRVNLVLNALS